MSSNIFSNNQKFTELLKETEQVHILGGSDPDSSGIRIYIQKECKKERFANCSKYCEPSDSTQNTKPDVSFE